MTDEEIINLVNLKNDIGFEQLEEFINQKGKFKSIRTINGESLLHLAVKKNNIKCVELLLKKGMNPLLKDKTKLQKTPIIYAIEKSYITMFDILCDTKIKPILTPKRYSEFSALGENSKINISIFKHISTTLVKIGVPINNMDYKNQTLLIKSILLNDINKVKVCLDLNIDLDNINRLPVRFALFQPKPNNEIIKLLLKSGAQLEIIGTDEWNNYSALNDAHTRDNFEIFKFLIVEMDALDTLSKHSLDEIIRFKEIDYLQFLWGIPEVYEFIMTNNLEGAFPEDIQKIFCF